MPQVGPPKVLDSGTLESFPPTFRCFTVVSKGGSATKRLTYVVKILIWTVC